MFIENVCKFHISSFKLNPYMKTMSLARLSILIGYKRPRDMDILVNNEWKYKSVCNSCILMCWCPCEWCWNLQSTRRYLRAALSSDQRWRIAANHFSQLTIMLSENTSHTHTHTCVVIHIAQLIQSSRPCGLCLILWKIFADCSSKNVFMFNPAITHIQAHVCLIYH